MLPHKRRIGFSSAWSDGHKIHTTTIPHPTTDGEGVLLCIRWARKGLVNEPEDGSLGGKWHCILATAAKKRAKHI